MISKSHVYAMKVCVVCGIGILICVILAGFIQLNKQSGRQLTAEQQLMELQEYIGCEKINGKIGAETINLYNLKVKAESK